MYRLPFARFERYTIYGTPAQWRARLAAFAAAGVRHFNLVFAGGDVRGQMLRFMETVAGG
jgi:alkanesulfonate monooxygenase SsuD/methylene tetrahydromethanopterin reductase-like flavin-dependent oxidoreductase (luciferase family)